MKLVAFSRPPALLVAFRRGLFAAEGLEVDFTRTSSSKAQLDALLQGEHDVAHTAADNVLARVDAGADVRIVLVVDRGTDLRLIASASVITVNDMAGRALGVDAPESGHAVLAYALLAEGGVRRDQLRVVSVGSTPDRCAALLEGRVDAALLAPPYDERALAAGCHVLADAASRFPGLPGLTVAVRATWAAPNAAAVTRYCRALLMGARWAADPANRDAVAALVAQDEDIAEAEAMRRLARERRAIVRSVAEMSDAVREALALRRAVGLAAAEAPVSRYFDPAYALAADPAFG